MEELQDVREAGRRPLGALNISEIGDEEDSPLVSPLGSAHLVDLQQLKIVT